MDGEGGSHGQLTEGGSQAGGAPGARGTGGENGPFAGVQALYRASPVLFVLFLLVNINWYVAFLLSLHFGGDSLGILPSVQGFVVKSHGATRLVTERVWLFCLIYPFITFLVTPAVVFLFLSRLKLLDNVPLALKLLIPAFLVIWSIAHYWSNTAEFIASVSDYRKLKRGEASAAVASSLASLRTHLAPDFERARKVWDPDLLVYEVGDSVSWQFETMPSLPRDLRLEAPFVRRPVPHEWSEADECTSIVSCEFFTDEYPIAFTVGHATEFCSEAPRMIWKDPDGTPHRQTIPPLFNWNVDALWHTEHYIIFGLEATYELAGHDERLAFWRLADAQVVISPSLVGRHTTRERLPPRLRLHGWREAWIAEMGEALVLARNDTTLAFWPGEHLYAAEVRGSAGK